MAENKKSVPEPAEINALADELLEDVTGGMVRIILQPFESKRCTACSCVYSAEYAACPKCGSK